MRPQQWERIKSVFHVACEMDVSRRSTYLDEACANDENLRQEVERLLALDDASGSIAFDTSCRKDAPRPHLLEVNTTLASRFKILRFVGAGGMGEVYEAQDLEFHERVALKTLRSEMVSDKRSLERFRREVQLARRVTHRNVCRVFDGGSHRDGDRDLVFLTMEYLQGETLSAYLDRQRRIHPDEALSLAQQMAQGLSALHETGIIHRDFKAANVMLTAAGPSFRAVITDFGLARPALQAAWDERNSTTSGPLLGTPDYMAPEQLEGKVAGPVSDIYSFSVVLFEMLCGQRPFSGGSAPSTIVKKLIEDPPHLNLYVPGLDPRWETLVVGCLERDLARRIPSVQQILGLLEDLARRDPGPESLTHATPSKRRVQIPFARSRITGPR